MKVIVNYSEIRATMTFMQEMDPCADIFKDDAFDSIEKFVEAMHDYNDESEGLITMDIKLHNPELDERNMILRDKFRDEDEFVMEMDSELYSRYCKFLAGKLRPIVKLIMAVGEFIMSFSEDCEQFFKGIHDERKLARLEKQEAERKAKAENEASEKEAQEQPDESVKDDEESVEDFIERCKKEVKTAKKEAQKPTKKAWGEL